MPVCGHATVAAHYVLVKERGLKNARLRQKTGAGILLIEILSDGDDLKIVMTQGAVEFGSFLQACFLPPHIDRAC